jgi:hypothetical protein
VRRDPAVFETAQRRAQQILTARAATALAPEGWIAGGRECERCPFSRACGNIRSAVPHQPNQPSARLTAAVVALAREAKRREAELDAAALRATQNEIKERLRADNVRRVASDGVSVTWSAIKGRPSRDMPAIRDAATAAGIDLKQYERTGEPSDRLVVQVAGEVT